MTDVVNETTAAAEAAADPVPADAVDGQLVRQLGERARAEGLQLTGEGGLLARLTKMVVESALDGEMEDHLGYARHDPAGRDGGNSRNGTRVKEVLTEAGPVQIAVPMTGTVHNSEGGTVPPATCTVTGRTHADTHPSRTTYRPVPPRRRQTVNQPAGAATPAVVIAEIRFWHGRPRNR